MLAGAVAMYGGRMWRAVHEPRPAPPAPVMQGPSATAAVVATDGRIELSADRRGVTRLTGDAPRWTAPQQTALDSLAITGPIVVGHAADAIVAIDLESGRTRFTWTPPAEERWAPQPPLALGGCLVATTLHTKKTALRCLDLATGAVRWTAGLAAAQACGAPVALPGAIAVPCAGATTIVDERTGAVGVEPGAGLIGDQPPLLLRSHGKLAVAPWSAARHRFLPGGDAGYGAAPTTGTSSAVIYKDRLVIRATEASDELAIIASHDGEHTAITAPVYRLADAAPLVRSCGGETSPRFQLLELAPRIGASFDPAAAEDRALALLDVEHGTLAWTSRKVSHLHRDADQAPICRDGHYFLPIELGDHAMLWVLDAETGKTAAVVAFDADQGASFARLTADQLDGERVVAVGKQGAIDARWQVPGHGLHSARGELETALGPLP
ncbi:MAG TPA: PQQ-binding-like beta-propeller repeat protein [Kofleriaceae bacterium]|nr:PQQ-binding-like beta-propeller repeat protein [Kofleriaceae bacterium]